MASVSVVMTGDEHRLHRALQKVVTQQNKMSTGYKKVARESKKASRSQNKAFGSQSLSSLKSYAAGIVSIGAGIAVAKTALNAFLDVQKRAAAGVETIDDKTRKLIQISGGDKGRFKELRGLSRGLQKQEGFKQERALDFVFSGVSLGFGDEELARAGKIRRIEKRDPVAVLEGIAGLRAAFGKQALGGTLEKQLSALLVGAAKSKVGLAEIAKASLTPLQSVKALGGTEIEALAAVSVASGALPSTEEASTSVARLADVLAKDKKFRGKGLLENLRDLRGLTSEEKIKQFGGNVRAKKGLDVLLARFPEFEATITAIEEAIVRGGTEKGAFRQALQLAGEDPLLAATRGKDISEARKRLAEQDAFAAPRLQIDTIRNVLDEQLARNDPGGFQSVLRRFGASIEFGTRELLGASPETLAGVAAQIAARQDNGLFSVGEDPVQLAKFEEIFTKLLDASERTAQALEGRTTALGTPLEDR